MRATEADILACFRLLLGRDINPEERAGHLGRVGEPLEALVRNFLASREFADRGMLQAWQAEGVDLADYGAFKVFASTEDAAVGRHVLAQVYEPEVQAVFRRYLRPGMVAIDVGANIGFFSMLAGALVGPEGGVLAVEPNPDNAALIERSRRASGFEHVKIAQMAAGRDIGLLALDTAFTNGTTSALRDGARSVACAPLDLYLPSRPVHFLKLDVEGAEGNVLAGAPRLLRTHRPIIVSEFSPGQLPGISGMTGEEYLGLLTGCGYLLHVLHKDREPVQGDIPGVMEAFHAAEKDHIDILAVPVGHAG